MIKFISRYPKNSADAVFVLNTRAGMKLGRRWYIPGLSGIALILPALILLIKGYSIRAMRPVDLPSNWISLHPGLKPQVIRSLYARWEPKVKSFTLKLLDGKRVLYPLFRDLPWDLAIMPFAVGYYVFGRFMLAKTFIATRDCTGCMVCEKRCPTNSIRMISDRPYWKFTCESCMRCMNLCPHRAIETIHTVTGLLWYICWSLIPGFAVFWMLKEGILTLEHNRWIFSLVNYLVIVPVSFLLIGVSYRVLHYLMRFKTINRIILLTSFTSYKFWRRYKAQNVLKNM